MRQACFQETGTPSFRNNIEDGMPVRPYTRSACEYEPFQVLHYPACWWAITRLFLLVCFQYSAKLSVGAGECGLDVPVLAFGPLQGRVRCGSVQEPLRASTQESCSQEMGQRARH
jgi:hypothetical protein